MCIKKDTKQTEKVTKEPNDIQVYSSLINLLKHLQKICCYSEIEIDKSLLKEPEEIKLAALIEEKQQNAERFMKDHKYLEQLIDASELHGPVNDFMDNVKILDVVDNKIKNNRLLLLQKAYVLFNKVANMSLLQEDNTKKKGKTK